MSIGGLTCENPSLLPSPSTLHISLIMFIPLLTTSTFVIHAERAILCSREPCTVQRSNLLPPYIGNFPYPLDPIHQIRYRSTSTISSYTPFAVSSMILHTHTNGSLHHPNLPPIRSSTTAIPPCGQLTDKNRKNKGG